MSPACSRRARRRTVTHGPSGPEPLSHACRCARPRHTRGIGQVQHPAVTVERANDARVPRPTQVAPTTVPATPPSLRAANFRKSDELTHRLLISGPRLTRNAPSQTMGNAQKGELPQLLLARARRPLSSSHCRSHVWASHLHPAVQSSTGRRDRLFCPHFERKLLLGSPFPTSLVLGRRAVSQGACGGGSLHHGVGGGRCAGFPQAGCAVWETESGFLYLLPSKVLLPKTWSKTDGVEV